jgi:hypothetical protein
MVRDSQIFLELSYHIPEEIILQKEHRENFKHFKLMVPCIVIQY